MNHTNEKQNIVDNDTSVPNESQEPPLSTITDILENIYFSIAPEDRRTILTNEGNMSPDDRLKLIKFLEGIYTKEQEIIKEELKKDPDFLNNIIQSGRKKQKEKLKREEDEGDKGKEGRLNQLLSNI